MKKIHLSSYIALVLGLVALGGNANARMVLAPSAVDCHATIANNAVDLADSSECAATPWPNTIQVTEPGKPKTVPSPYKVIPMIAPDGTEIAIKPGDKRKIERPVNPRDPKGPKEERQYEWVSPPGEWRLD